MQQRVESRAERKAKRRAEKKAEREEVTRNRISVALLGWSVELVACVGGLLSKLVGCLGDWID